MIEHEDELTRLLLTASIHHLRSTIELLPVGQVEICEQGVITAADRWTETILGYAERELCGKKLSDILGAGAALLISMFQEQNYNSIGAFEFVTVSGASISTKVVLVPPIEQYKLAFYVIFMKSNDHR